jgi:2-polyprenyl-6-methoxyphenol hydroxylase-like FAD-dependent oxidoreductase
VGAGIGGIAAALGLAEQGWGVSILERAPRLRAAGGGIGLTPNAIRALDAIGARQPVGRAAIEQAHGGIRRPNGTWISRADLAFIRARFGDPVLAIHRSALLEVMAELLPKSALRTATTAVSVDPGDAERPAVVRSDRGDIVADLVVAADGIHSAIRNSLFTDHPGLRYAGYTSWRMVVPACDVPVAGETWGRGLRFSILPLPGGLVHCSALAAAPIGSPNDRADLVARFGGWHPPIPQLIDAARSYDVLHHDIVELPKVLPAFHYGRVVIVGDAAHAMTPNIGAAGLAIEDAATIMRTLGPAGPMSAHAVPAALREFTRIRRPRSIRLARQARRIGAIGCWSSTPAVAFRDIGVAAAGRIPAVLTARALDPLMGWRPPEPPSTIGSV